MGVHSTSVVKIYQNLSNNKCPVTNRTSDRLSQNVVWLFFVFHLLFLSYSVLVNEFDLIWFDLLDAFAK